VAVVNEYKFYGATSTSAEGPITLLNPGPVIEKLILHTQQKLLLMIGQSLPLQKTS